MKDRFRFRAWDNLEEKYIYDAQDQYDDNVECFGNMFDTYGDRYIVEQCTGLTDKNGKLIYEGDRVKFNKNGNRDGWIIWYLSSWGIETASEFIPMEYPFAKDDPKDIEIVGNIHEENEDE